MVKQKLCKICTAPITNPKASYCCEECRKIGKKKIAYARLLRKKETKNRSRDWEKKIDAKIKKGNGSYADAQKAETIEMFARVNVNEFKKTEKV